jgi:hypothetical protein
MFDELLQIKTLTATPVTTTEAAMASETRDATTGQACVDISKCPQGGMSIVVIASADTGTSSDRTQTVRIYGCDTVDGTYVLLLTFPTLTYADTTAKRLVMNLATQYKYLTNTITLANSNGTMSRFYQIYIGIGEMDKMTGG